MYIQWNLCFTTTHWFSYFLSQKRGGLKTEGLPVSLNFIFMNHTKRHYQVTTDIIKLQITGYELDNNMSITMIRVE